MSELLRRPRIHICDVPCVCNRITDTKTPFLSDGDVWRCDCLRVWVVKSRWDLRERPNHYWRRATKRQARRILARNTDS